MTAPMTADIDKDRAVMEIKKTWMHELHGIMNSPRLIEMTFHIPMVDKDKEIISAGAMAEALQDYMKFPIISDFHKERPVGIAEKTWQTKADEFKSLVRIRDDRSTDDVWEKMNLPEGTPGRYDQVSIAGKRIVYSQECNVPLSMRKSENPCRTEKLRLDSISVCDDRARNEGTELHVVKAQSDDLETFVYTTFVDLKQVQHSLIKAETTESELIHPVTDGANQPDLKKDHPATGTCTVKGGKMKKCNDPKVKKTSEEEGQEPVEETEAKKGEKYEADPEKQVEKGEEKKEPEPEKKVEKSEDESSEMSMMKEILATLKQLVSSDKKVHKEVEKAEETTAEKKEEKVEKKEEKKIEKAIPAPEDATNVIKAQMEQEFQKALNAAVAPLNDKITALEAEVKRLGDEPLYKSGFKLTEMFVDQEGKPELGNAGMLDAQRKKTSGRK